MFPKIFFGTVLYTTEPNFSYAQKAYVRRARKNPLWLGTNNWGAITDEKNGNQIR